MPTAVLAGAFGQRNPGDEALLDAFIDALPGWDVIATAAVPPHGRDTDTVSSDDPTRVARAVARADAFDESPPFELRFRGAGARSHADARARQCRRHAATPSRGASEC